MKVAPVLTPEEHHCVYGEKWNLTPLLEHTEMYWSDCCQTNDVFVQTNQ